MSSLVLSNNLNIQKIIEKTHKISDKESLVDAKSILDRSIAGDLTLENITSIGQSAFYNCTNLTSVNLPAVTSIGINAFDNCTNLTSVNLPAVTSIDDYAFRDCRRLASMNLPAVTSIGDQAFYYCAFLASVDLPAVTSIGDEAFYLCINLDSVILRNTEKVCELGDEYAFNNTCITSGTGYIYVPRSLIEDYKVATNWSTYANQFRALEDYTVDGTTTGALD